jgi:hypothetical protein
LFPSNFCQSPFGSLTPIRLPKTDDDFMALSATLCTSFTQETRGGVVASLPYYLMSLRYAIIYGLWSQQIFGKEESNPDADQEYFSVEVLLTLH